MKGKPTIWPGIYSYMSNEGSFIAGKGTLGELRQSPLLDSRFKGPIARNLMIALVAGAGFEPATFGL